MAIILTNQASLSYRYGTSVASAVSNVTTTVLNGTLSIEKTSLSECYRANQTLTYIISIRNNSSSAVTNAIINDDLGAFDVDGRSITPLDYIGDTLLFINGVQNDGITVTVNDNGVHFVIAELPANANAQLIYLTRVNEYACAAEGSTIINTATAERGCNCPCDDTTGDSHTISVCEYADLRIVKSCCPNPATCEDRLTYTFDIYNYGNITANEVVLTDVFMPELRDIEVRVDGNIIPSNYYRYSNGTITLPSSASEYAIEIPPAECERDPITGIVHSNPSSIQITVSGTL